MKKHSFAKLTGLSWDWMLTILFRPFSLKKWIMLGIIMIFAGYGGNTNFNYNIPAPGKKPIKTLPAITQQVRPPMPQFNISGKDFAAQAANIKSNILDALRKNKLFATLIASFIVSLIVVILLWMYIKAIFSFIFLDALVKNDASVRMPFHKNKRLGASYFRWNVAFSTIAIIVFGALALIPVYSMLKSGIIFGPKPLDLGLILRTALPYIIAFGATFILFLLIYIFVNDFLIIIMRAQQVGVVKGWGILLKVVAKNAGDFLLYLLVKFGLGILGIFALLILLLASVLFILLAGSALALIGFLLYSAAPASMKMTATIILSVIGIPLFVFAFFLTGLVLIPVPIFFRYFSIHFLGSIDSSFDLFEKSAAEIGEEGKEKYKKSLALVWITLLSGLVPVGLFVAAIFVGGTSMAKEFLPQMGIMDTQAQPSIQPAGISILPAEPVKKDMAKVYLKNGQYFEAEIEKEGPDTIVFKLEGGTFTVNVKEIESIERPKK